MSASGAGRAGSAGEVFGAVRGTGEWLAAESDGADPGRVIGIAVVRGRQRRWMMKKTNEGEVPGRGGGVLTQSRLLRS
jgi:hypothetical protein